MLGPWRRHSAYQAWLERQLNALPRILIPQLLGYAKLAEKLYQLDLDSIKSIVKPYYSPIGRPAINQPEIFRALVAMVHCKIPGITELVQTLRTQPVLAISCGFQPGKTPSVGVFYDLLNRFWPTEQKTKTLRKPKKRKQKRPKFGSKLQPKNPGIIERLVEKAISGKQFKPRAEGILQQIFAQCAVIPSSQLGLLGDTLNMTIAADGAPLETGARPYGTKICDCRERAIYRCNCPRIYTDPTANWGWDSYHQRWFYGHTLYCVTSADSQNDLPIQFLMPQASRFDGVSFVPAILQTIDQYPHFGFSRVLLDSAHDAYAIYDLIHHLGIEPFIDLNNRSKGKSKYSGPLKINPDGVPLCQAGLPMLNWGFNKQRCRIKWRCPCYKDLSKCPNGRTCSSSPYGRVIYTKPIWDRRLFTTTPRGSREWKQVYAKRTSVERGLKRILVDYRIENSRVRDKRYWFWRAILAGINQHLDAQIQLSKNSLLDRLKCTTEAA